MRVSVTRVEGLEMKDFVFISSFRKSVLNVPFKSVFDGVFLVMHHRRGRILRVANAQLWYLQNVQFVQFVTPELPEPSPVGHLAAKAGTG